MGNFWKYALPALGVGALGLATGGFGLLGAPALAGAEGAGAAAASGATLGTEALSAPTLTGLSTLTPEASLMASAPTAELGATASSGMHLTGLSALTPKASLMASTPAEQAALASSGMHAGKDSLSSILTNLNRLKTGMNMMNPQGQRPMPQPMMDSGQPQPIARRMGNQPNPYIQALLQKRGLM